MIMKKYGFGVDIGGTTCKLGLFETTGNLLEKWEIPTDTSRYCILPEKTYGGTDYPER